MGMVFGTQCELVGGLLDKKREELVSLPGQEHLQRMCPQEVLHSKSTSETAVLTTNDNSGLL